MLLSLMASVAEQDGDALVLDGVQTVCKLKQFNKTSKIATSKSNDR